jgi:hypothetical protein
MEASIMRKVVAVLGMVTIVLILLQGRSWNVQRKEADSVCMQEQARSPEPAELNRLAMPEEKAPDGRAVHAECPPIQAARLHRRLDYFKDTTVPMEERRRSLELLVQQDDEDSTKVLMALGDERIYLNRVAVEALGALPSDRHRQVVVEYLKGKLSDPDARVLCAALRSLVLQSGEAAIPAIAGVMERNRVRADGHQEFVLTAAVEALNLLHSAQTVPALAAELGRSEEKGWSMEYGSKLIAALGQMGTPEGRQASAAYAGRLAAKMPSDPLASAYFEKKIAEAQSVSQRQ